MRVQPQVVIVADDLTGAADSAAGLAKRGLITLVVLDPDLEQEADALVFSTESRHLRQEEAVRRVLETTAVLRKYLAQETICYYKKIDSTLRGHPVAELQALINAFNSSKTLCAPAFPAQGRTTVGGCQLVNKRLLEDTHFGSEVTTSRLVNLFRDSSLSVREIGLDDVRIGSKFLRDLFEETDADIIIADAQTDGDLNALALGALQAQIRLLCGSAGLISAVCANSSWTPRAARPELSFPGGGRTLVVAGSRNHRTEEQVLKAELNGSVVLKVAAPMLDTQETSPDKLVENACKALLEGSDVIVTTAGSSEARCSEREVARRLAGIASAIFEQVALGSMVLTGGDIASAVLEVLQTTAIWVLGEVQPGVPYGCLLGGRGAGLPVVTKAGGFGTNDCLCRAMKFHQCG